MLVQLLDDKAMPLKPSAYLNIESVLLTNWHGTHREAERGHPWVGAALIWFELLLDVQILHQAAGM